MCVARLISPDVVIEEAAKGKKSPTPGLTAGVRLNFGKSRVLKKLAIAQTILLN